MTAHVWRLFRANFERFTTVNCTAKKIFVHRHRLKLKYEKKKHEKIQKPEKKLLLGFMRKNSIVNLKICTVTSTQRSKKSVCDNVSNVSLQQNSNVESYQSPNMLSMSNVKTKVYCLSITKKIQNRLLHPKILSPKVEV